MKKKNKKKKLTKRIAIRTFILNFFLPGLGTLTARKFNKGAMQMILAIVGVSLWFVMMAAGIIFVVAWIWALTSSIKLIMTACK